MPYTTITIAPVYPPSWWIAVCIAAAVVMVVAVLVSAFALRQSKGLRSLVIIAAVLVPGLIVGGASDAMGGEVNSEVMSQQIAALDGRLNYTHVIFVAPPQSTEFTAELNGRLVQGKLVQTPHDPNTYVVDATTK